MKYTVTLALTVEADDLDEASDLGIALAEHICDTFNDNGSIEPEVGIAVGLQQ